MFKILALFQIISLVFGYESESFVSIGYGLHKLKRYNTKVHLKDKSTTTCDYAPQYWYQDAVIDNFAPIENQKKWVGQGQRYWINKELWGGVGFPVFVFIGGEGAESCTRLSNKMYMYQLAQEHQALLVDIEHRFYGESYPTTDMSTENLKYLSSSQALADLSRLITHIKKELNSPESKVITIGGSYPGNLAAWFRLKYPSITYGSIASSAPVTAKVNFYEYMDVVGQSILHFSGQKCYDAFTISAEIVANLAYQGFGSSGMAKLETDFKTCGPITNELDLAVFLSDLMGNVQGTVQYNNEHLNVLNITNICSTMLAGDGSNDGYYTQFVSLMADYRASNNQVCEDASWTDTVAYMSNPAKDPNNAARPWVYQTCNEFGYFQTTDSKNQPFNSWKWVNLDFSRALCSASFNGWKSDPQVEWVNEEYGDVHIAGTNILFPSGTIDPWHVLGVTNYTSLPQKTELPVYIEGTAHCNDLYAPANSDPASLVNARQIIANKLSELLSV
eukprot:gene4529-6394_t